MKKLLAIACLVSILYYITGCTNNSKTKAATGSTLTLSKDSLIKRGEYLVTIGGCNDCHTPKVFSEKGMGLDTKRILSGHPREEVLPEFFKDGVSKGIIQSNNGLTAWKGPWGISFAANITPDGESGIGNWTLEQFKTSLREGKAKGLPGSRMLLPPMPWFNFAVMSDTDIESVFEYLKSLPPVKNHVPAPMEPNA